MSGSRYSLTIHNPRQRSRPLAVHAGLGPEDAAELADVYLCLGYSPSAIQAEAATVQEAA
jgi:hypothetical protein